jgi:hypothetical protein
LLRNRALWVAWASADGWAKDLALEQHGLVVQQRAAKDGGGLDESRALGGFPLRIFPRAFELPAEFFDDVLGRELDCRVAVGAG